MANFNSNQDKAQLEKGVQDVIKLGESWGMTNLEIQGCLQVAAGEKYLIANNDLPTGKVSGSSMHLCKLIVTIFTSITAFIVVSSLVFYTVMLACSMSNELENQVGKIVAPLIYPVMRMARMTLKPAADKLDISRKPYFILLKNCYFASH